MEMAISGTNDGGLTLMDAAQVFIRNQTSTSTQKAYAYDLKKWFTWLSGQGFTLNHTPSAVNVLDFRDFLTQTLSSRSAARIFNTCKSFYRFLGGFNPFQTLKAPQRVKNATPKVPDDILVIKMLEMCDDRRDKFILTLLLNGLRRNEVATIQSGAIEWSPVYGMDIIKIIGKGNKERLVPANRETSLAFRAYKVPNGPYMFANGTSHITGRMVEYVSEKWSKKAGLKTSPHKFRHHYATRMVRAKVDVFSLANLMGHESVTSTQVYVRLDLADAVRAAALDPLNNVVVDGEVYGRD